MLNRLGIEASLTLDAWGWFPVGKGQIRAVINGAARATAPLDLVGRGALRQVKGRAVAANLPAHIPQRMADRAASVLQPLGAALDIRPERVRAACPGAGIFLTAEYEHAPAGFCSLGAVGKPSEAVAEEAATLLLQHHASGAALDRHLGDQILLPLCVARGPSRYSVEAITRHLETNLWVIEQVGVAAIATERTAAGTGIVSVTPRPLR
jgi:RNA 3'-terminal phosphate cyclase (ATP)